MRQRKRGRERKEGKKVCEREIQTNRRREKKETEGQQDRDK